VFFSKEVEQYSKSIASAQKPALEGKASKWRGLVTQVAFSLKIVVTCLQQHCKYHVFPLSCAGGILLEPARQTRHEPA
jgi:hypothetical protein